MTPVVYVDNKAALELIKHNRYHKRTKHIAVRFLFVREIYERKQAEFKYIPSTENLSDALTKPLNKPIFEKLRQLTGLQPWLVKQSFS